MGKFISVKEAVSLIPDGATVGVAGMGLSGWAEEIAQGIAENFRETGHPRNLTLRQGSAMGDWRERGITRLGIEGLVSRWSAAHIGSAFALCDLVRANRIECHCLPQGVIVNLWREIAAGRPGLVSKVGLGTFVDPRVEGGRMNSATTGNAAELITFQGEEYLFYKGFKLDVALLRGTAADEEGNITFSKESILNEGLAVAQAAHNSGGIVIVQVEYAAQKGSFHPKEVRIPGILVDHVVLATKQDACWQTEGVYYEPAFSGEIKKPLGMLPGIGLDAAKVIARRAAGELKAGDIVNLGVGIPASIANIVAEEGCTEEITLTAESGVVGGVPAPLPNFGSAYNPRAVIEHGAMFDLIDGGGLDVTFLGMGEADERGNVNVSKFGSRLTGPGGFINIASNTKRVVFCGTFMTKANVEIRDGRVVILEEGTGRKFRKQVEQITFAGQYARKDQTVLYVTERCVFSLKDGEMTLVEIAPGIDLEKDILSNMDFRPRVADNLSLMDPSLFTERWGRLGNSIRG